MYYHFAASRIGILQSMDIELIVPNSPAKYLPFLRSLTEPVRRLGISNATLWVVSRALAAASRGRCRLYRYHFVAQPISNAPLVPPGRTSKIVIRRVQRGDPLIAQFPRPPEVIARRFDIGAQCLAAETEGTFVGYLWLKETEYPEDEVRCQYVLESPESGVWDFDVYIAPDFRFGRTFVRLWDSANAMLRQRGYRWSLSRISGFNPESLAAHGRLDVRHIGAATFLRLGKMQIAFFDRFPIIHVGWRDSQVPRVRLGVRA
jgi:hypothetical protein